MPLPRRFASASTFDLHDVTAAGFDPRLHPRDRHGRFIDVGSLIRWLTGPISNQGTVDEINPDGTLRVTRSDGARVKVRSADVVDVEMPKATLHHEIPPGYEQATRKLTKEEVWDARAGDVFLLDGKPVVLDDKFTGVNDQYLANVRDTEGNVTPMVDSERFRVVREHQEIDTLEHQQLVLPGTGDGGISDYEAAGRLTEAGVGSAIPGGVVVYLSQMDPEARQGVIEALEGLAVKYPGAAGDIGRVATFKSDHPYQDGGATAIWFNKKSAADDFGRVEKAKATGLISDRVIQEIKDELIDVTQHPGDHNAGQPSINIEISQDLARADHLYGVNNFSAIDGITDPYERGRYTTTHEFGHAVEMWLAMMLAGAPSVYTAVGNPLIAGMISKPITPEMGDAFIGSIEGAHDRLFEISPNPPSDLESILGLLDQDGYRVDPSGYATTEPAEFFAESFAAHELADRTAPWLDEILQQIEDLPAMSVPSIPPEGM